MREIVLGSLQVNIGLEYDIYREEKLHIVCGVSINRVEKHPINMYQNLETIGVYKRFFVYSYNDFIKPEIKAKEFLIADNFKHDEAQVIQFKMRQTIKSIDNVFKSDVKFKLRCPEYIEDSDLINVEYMDRPHIALVADNFYINIYATNIPSIVDFMALLYNRDRFDDMNRVKSILNNYAIKEKLHNMHNFNEVYKENLEELEVFL